MPHLKHGDSLLEKIFLKYSSSFSQFLAQPLKEKFSMLLQFSQGTFGPSFFAACFIEHSSFLQHLFVFLAYNNIHILSNKTSFKTENPSMQRVLRDGFKISLQNSFAVARCRKHHKIFWLSPALALSHKDTGEFFLFHDLF